MEYNELFDKIFNFKMYCNNVKNELENTVQKYEICKKSVEDNNNAILNLRKSQKQNLFCMYAVVSIELIFILLSIINLYVSIPLNLSFVALFLLSIPVVGLSINGYKKNKNIVKNINTLLEEINYNYENLTNLETKKKEILLEMQNEIMIFQENINNITNEDFQRQIQRTNLELNEVLLDNNDYNEKVNKIR